MFHDVAGLVLAGGRGTRMGGRDKCLVPVGGVPVVHRVLARLAELFEQIVLVTNSPERYGELTDTPVGPPRLRLTGDRFTGCGPLAGIHAGLSACRAGAVFCVACDMPFLDRELVSRQVERYRVLAADGACEALVPRIGGLIEPLHAVYARSLVGAAERILGGAGREPGHSIRVLLAEARTAYWELEDTSANRSAFFNVNTPKDLARLGSEPRAGEVTREVDPCGA